MMAFAALRTVLESLILHMYGSAAATSVFSTIVMSADLDTVLYFVIIGITRAADQLREYQDRTLRAAALEAELSGAQLRYLERQLQPYRSTACTSFPSWRTKRRPRRDASSATCSRCSARCGESRT